MNDRTGQLRIERIAQAFVIQLDAITRGLPAEDISAIAATVMVSAVADIGESKWAPPISVLRDLTECTYRAHAKSDSLRILAFENAFTEYLKGQNGSPSDLIPWMEKVREKLQEKL
jgi:hypothetical protein